MVLLVPTGVDYRFRRVPLLTLGIALLISLGFILQQLYWQRHVLPDWLAALSAAGGGDFANLFSPGNAVSLVATLLMLALVVSPLEDVLAKLRFALISILGIATGTALFALLNQHSELTQANLTGLAVAAAVSLLLGVAAVRLSGLRIQTSCLLLAPRASRSEVVSLPLVAFVPLWLLLPAGVALWRNSPEQLALGLEVNAGGLLLGVVLALLFNFERERLGESSLAQAITLRNAGSPSGAVECLRRAIRWGGDTPEVRVELGECYVAMRRSVSAARHFGKAIEQFLDRGERERAAQIYVRFRHLLPNASMAAALELSIAQTLSSLRWETDAAAAFARAYQGAKDTAEGHRALLQAAETYCRLDQPDKAQALLERARYRCHSPERLAAIEDALRRCQRMKASEH